MRPVPACSTDRFIEMRQRWSREVCAEDRAGMSACNQLGSNGDNHMLQEMTVRGFMCSANEEKAMKSSGNSGVVRLCGGGRLCSPSYPHQHSRDSGGPHWPRRIWAIIWQKVLNPVSFQ